MDVKISILPKLSFGENVQFYSPKLTMHTHDQLLYEVEHDWKNNVKHKILSSIFEKRPQICKIVFI